MAKNEIVMADADEPADLPTGKKPAPRAGAPGTGFFTVYKYGKGKWTRLGSFGAIGLLGLLIAYKVYDYLLPHVPNGMSIPQAKKLYLGIAVAFFAAFSLLIYRIGNQPRNVDFLIDTDSEMKKVNWTTKGELFGSTRVVVIFLIFIGLFLALVDLVFAALFQWVGILHRG